MIYTLGDTRPVFEGEGHFVADSAAIIGNVVLKSEASVWFNSVLRGDMDRIEIGSRSNIQDGSVLHTDPGFRLVVGSGVTVGHRVMLHGCTIGDDSLIGIGSTILNGATIGSNCIVGAHALVTEDTSFEDGVLILGAPANVKRRLSDAEIDAIRASANHYVENAARFHRRLEVL